MEVFAKIAHTNIKDAIEYFTAKLKKEINKRIGMFLCELPDIDSNIDLTLKLNECIKSIKSMPIYSSIPNKEALLIDALQHTSKNSTSIVKMFNTLTNEAITNPLTTSTSNMTLDISRKELKRKTTQERKSIVPLSNVFESEPEINNQSSICLTQESTSSLTDKGSSASNDTQARITTITSSSSEIKTGAREIQAYITTPVSYSSITVTIVLNEPSATPQQIPLNISRKHSRKKMTENIDTKKTPVSNNYENDNSTLFSKNKSRKTSSKTSESTNHEKNQLKTSTSTASDLNKLGSHY